MTGLILTTFDWVPQLPRGFVRDLRVRWALEEAGLPYSIATVPFDDRTDAAFTAQPFRQVPWLIDGARTIFESGAILLHLGERSPALLPREDHARGEALQWLFAALNSVEMAGQPYALLHLFNPGEESRDRGFFRDFLRKRLDRMEPVLTNRVWLAGDFSIADIMMADVLRQVDHVGGLVAHPACRAYVTRATVRPAFAKAHADQLAHFASADAIRERNG